MPNQRKKGKKVVGVWLSESERNTLKAIAERTGQTVADIIRAAINEETRKELNNEKND